MSVRFRTWRFCRAALFCLVPPAVPLVLHDVLAAARVPSHFRLPALLAGTFVFVLCWRLRRGGGRLRVALPRPRQRTVDRADPLGDWFTKGGTQAGHDVVLVSPGYRKIPVIAAVRRMTGLGLKEAKDLIDTAPGLVMTGVTSEIADRAREVLEGLGATVTVSEPELFAHRF